MSLVSGWTKKLIGEVCKTGAGGTPLKSFKEYYEGGEIPWLLSGEVAQGEIFKSENFITQKGLENSSAKMFPVNTVLVAMYGATAGQVGILRFEAATNQAVCGILPNDRFIPEYIYYALLSKKAELISKAAGNAQPNISQIKIRNTEIPVPTLLEQKRIVSIVDEAFEAIDIAIDNTKQNLTNARELFNSYLNVIFTEKGDGWVNKKLGDISEVQSGGTPLRSKNEYWGGSMAWYSSGELNDLYTSIPERNVTELGLKNSNAKSFPKGSLLIGMYDTAALKMSILDREAAFNQAIAGVKPSNEIDLTFILHAINSVKPELLNLRRGVRQKNLSLQKIKDIVLAVPELREQQLVVRQLACMSKETQRLEAIYRQKLTALNELKQSILHKAFTGELTADTADLKTNIKPEAICT
jgi:type I restriction enzyme S subunit